MAFGVRQIAMTARLNMGDRLMTRITLLERLKEVQRTPRYQGRDITTISAVLSNQALEKHIEVCEQAAGLGSRERQDNAA
jgi:hypothetical protein